MHDVVHTARTEETIMGDRLPKNPGSFFGEYMKLVDVPRLTHEKTGDAGLEGKTLGIVNGGAWIQLWSYYFARKHLPGVKLVNIGNEAVQLNFMQAHADKQPCPPESNIRLFAEYARQLHELAHVDAIIVTCSTMNRSIDAVRAAVPGIPVVQIDEPMMEEAVSGGGTVLVIATHGPTVESTKALLRETAIHLGTADSTFYEGSTVEEAFHLLGEGDIRGHNQAIANAIRDVKLRKKIDRVVLAQLSMSVFLFDHPDPVKEFGIPVLASGEVGFKRMRRVLSEVPRKAQP